MIQVKPFEEQLAGWYTDEGSTVFRRWLDYQHSSLVIDHADEPLIRESDEAADG